MQITQAQALAAIALLQSNNTITAQQICNLLQNCSVTFAQLLYVTHVQLAAAHKQQTIYKVTSANVQIAANIAAHNSMYARKVRKSAQQFAQNDAQAIAQFEAQSNYFAHTATHCIVAHKQHSDKLYLYAIYNRARSVYVHNNAVVNKQHVAQYCTPSAAKKLLQASNTVHNVAHNITHDVQVRTIALQNIVQIAARKQILHV